MVAKIEIRDANLEDARRLSTCLRPADEQELIAASGDNIVETIEKSIKLSTHAWAAEVEGELLGLFGFAPASLMGGVGIPWFIGGHAINQHPGSLTKITKRYLSDIRQTYPALYNFVDARNIASIRWLKRLGFEIHTAEPYGVEGLPFHKFEMKDSYV